VWGEQQQIPDEWAVGFRVATGKRRAAEVMARVGGLRYVSVSVLWTRCGSLVVEVLAACARETHGTGTAAPRMHNKALASERPVGFGAQIKSST
jgi:hypothetical protein